MGIITDKVALGYQTLSSYALDVSSYVRVQSLAGSGNRMVVIDSSGNFLPVALPGLITDTGIVGIFGNGSDGTVTISSNTVLTKEMNYENLYITGGILYTSGYIVRVRNVLSMANVYISTDGSDGIPGSTTTGGQGGTCSMTAQRYHWQSLPTAGGVGNTKINNANTNTAGAAGGVSNYGSTTRNPGFFAVGAGGGGGGGHGSTTGQTLPGAGANVWLGWSGGAGGTGTGTSTTLRASGGGGGGGGGITVVFAKEISTNGANSYITAKGGNGGSGGNNTTEFGGGGGGGGGGTAILVYQKVTPGKSLPTMRATGGVAGNYGSPAAGNGSTGYTYLYRLWDPSSASFNISPSSVNFGTAGGDTSINVAPVPQNINWIATDSCSWISLTNATATGKNHFHIICDTQASTGAARSGVVTLTSTNYSLAPLAINVTQDASQVSAGEIQLRFGGAGGYTTTGVGTFDYNSPFTGCDFAYIDVSASASWTLTPAGGGVWSFSATSGGAGVTTTNISYSPDIIPDDTTFQFKIGATVCASVRLYGTNGCA